MAFHETFFFTQAKKMPVFFFWKTWRVHIECQDVRVIFFFKIVWHFKIFFLWEEQIPPCTEINFPEPVGYIFLCMLNRTMLLCLEKLNSHTELFLQSNEARRTLLLPAKKVCFHHLRIKAKIIITISPTTRLWPCPAELSALRMTEIDRQ